MIFFRIHVYVHLLEGIPHFQWHVFLAFFPRASLTSMTSATMRMTREESPAVFIPGFFHHGSQDAMDGQHHLGVSMVMGLPQARKGWFRSWFRSWKLPSFEMDDEQG